MQPPQAVEARSLVRLPIRVALTAKRFSAVATVRGKRTRQRKVPITGRVTENGTTPVQGARYRAGYYSVSLYRRTEASGRDQYLGDLGVDPSGRFHVVVRDRVGVYYRGTTIDNSTGFGRTAPPGLGDPPWLAPGGCVRANSLGLLRGQRDRPGAVDTRSATTALPSWSRTPSAAENPCTIPFAILLTPHFTGLAKWARRAHFL